ncbi:MAG: hypothetical protein WC755_08455, partial [Candidatus Woesearchaeota archaeon]
MIKFYLSEDKLRELYIQNNLSINDIVNKLNIKRSTVRIYLNKYNIKKTHDKIKQSMKNTLFEKGHKRNLGKKRIDMVNNKYASGLFEEKHHNWKGDAASYGPKHGWISSRYGFANKCLRCKRKDKLKYEWANI